MRCKSAKENFSKKKKKSDFSRNFSATHLKKRSIPIHFRRAQFGELAKVEEVLSQFKAKMALADITVSVGGEVRGVTLPGFDRAAFA